MSKSLKKQVWNKARSKVFRKILNKIHIHIENKVWGEVWDKVHRIIRNQARSKVFDEVKGDE